MGQNSKAGSMQDPLITFTCIEKADEEVNEPAEKAVAEIRDVASKVKAKNIALFPFAHLSRELGSPAFAIQVLASIEAILKNMSYQVLRVPFGWNKVFEFKSKGHPLAVLSRSIPKKANSCISLLK